jgi:ectoine hydroxylase-related dioxygenase (phytanoyl-CoA dioxygenase family)
MSAQLESARPPSHDECSPGDGSVSVARAFRHDADFDVDRFRRCIDQVTDRTEMPMAAAIEHKIPVYDGRELHAIARDSTRRLALLDELAAALANGPGAFAIRSALTDEDHALGAVTEVFTGIIEQQHRDGRAVGDHFAAPGSNDRIWNAHERLAAAAPAAFSKYVGADAIALASEAWLGPHWQLTAQVNRVNPGGTAQSPHCDYHVGFFAPEQMARFPQHVHRLSMRLTLQGAIAHTDMPIESGPTMLLPYSHHFGSTYIAATRPEFASIFQERSVQLPLSRGDALFFNPGLMHGAGANRTADVWRMANLLQVSSPFGRTMEATNTDLTALAAYPHLLDIADPITLENVLTAACEGYAFPTNLDRDPPVDGLAPPSQADLVRRAVAERWPIERLRTQLAARRARRSPVDG